MWLILYALYTSQLTLLALYIDKGYKKSSALCGNRMANIKRNSIFNYIFNKILFVIKKIFIFAFTPFAATDAESG